MREGPLKRRDTVDSGFAARCEAGLCPAVATLLEFGAGIARFRKSGWSARQSLASHRAAEPTTCGRLSVQTLTLAAGFGGRLKNNVNPERLCNSWRARFGNREVKK